MDIDPRHERKLEQAIAFGAGGKPTVNLDLNFLAVALHRLSLWERGVLMEAITRACVADTYSIEQRALLALFVHQGGEDE